MILHCVHAINSRNNTVETPYYIVVFSTRSDVSHSDVMRALVELYLDEGMSWPDAVLLGRRDTYRNGFHF